MALFCSTRTTTRRFSACPSALLSLLTCRDSPIAPGASIRVIGTFAFCSRMFVTLFARSSLSFWFTSVLPFDHASLDILRLRGQFQQRRFVLRINLYLAVPKVHRHLIEDVVIVHVAKASSRRLDLGLVRSQLFLVQLHLLILCLQR